MPSNDKRHRGSRYRFRKRSRRLKSAVEVFNIECAFKAWACIFRTCDFTLEGKRRLCPSFFHNSLRCCTLHRTSGTTRCRYCMIILTASCPHPRRFSALRRFPGHLITMRCRSISILDNDSFAEITITWARGVKQSRGVRVTDRKEREEEKKKKKRCWFRGASGRAVTIINNVDLLPPSKLRVSRGN